MAWTRASGRPDRRRAPSPAGTCCTSARSGHGRESTPCSPPGARCRSRCAASTRWCSRDPCNAWIRPRWRTRCAWGTSATTSCRRCCAARPRSATRPATRASACRASKRVALVHDWLTGLRGGERVLQAICEMYPEADVFTLVHVPGSCGPVIESRRITTSFLQRLPAGQSRYRHYLPLFPLAIESLDLRGYDLVISTSHAVAKGCRPAPGARHVAYVHTPMRYVWDQFDAYFGRDRAGPLTRSAAHLVAPWLRRWDVRSTARAHGLIANSRFVSQRMQRVWGRAADAVVYPPVETSRFRPASDLPSAERGPGGYALIVSALVPYKRIELAVQAFTRLGRKLVVAGDGPELSRLAAH